MKDEDKTNEPLMDQAPAPIVAKSEAPKSAALDAPILASWQVEAWKIGRVILGVLIVAIAAKLGVPLIPSAAVPIPVSKAVPVDGEDVALTGFSRNDLTGEAKAKLDLLGIDDFALTIRPKNDGKPPVLPPDTKPEIKPEPLAAIAKIVMAGSYCSGTVVTGKRPDGRYNIVSAAHCFKTSGEQVTVVMRDGRTFRAVVSSINRKSDCAILITDVVESLPFAKVAVKSAPQGSRIWHAGYGFHIPANREEGTVVAAPNPDGQVQYKLSVSSGDSGGGIMLNAAGELLSPVCCTTNIAGVGDVWGASPEVIWRMLASPAEFLDVPPQEMPLRKLPVSQPMPPTR